jgi:hypothetical protein
MEEKNKKKKKLFFRIIKKIKISHLIILIALLIANSYAWFIYVNTVSNKIDVHVKSWQIDFFDGSQPVTDYIEIEAEEVYPGMDDFENEVYVHNYGETAANVEFKILEADILGEIYRTVEGKQETGATLTGDELTSDEVVDMLQDDFPFTITLELDSDTIQPEVGIATFTATIEWPYESGNDALDTQWGMDAYDFIHDNPGDPCIRLEIKIVISQDNS